MRQAWGIGTTKIGPCSRQWYVQAHPRSREKATRADAPQHNLPFVLTSRTELRRTNGPDVTL